MIIVVMGVSGVGKTTVGQLLARRIGGEFSDADQFHSAANIAKMKAGGALTDADRAPWLAAMRHAIEGWRAAGHPHVLACSTLKVAYREALKHGDADVHFVYLRGSFEMIEARMKSRPEHFFGVKMLASQFDALEPPDEHEALCVDAAQTPEAIVETVMTALAQDGGEY